MKVLLVIIFFIVALIMLSWGGNLLVDSAVNIGIITGVSQIVIGCTLVSLITTLPELLVTIFSSSNGAEGIAVGNAIGSMMFNFLIIVGVLLLARPMMLKLKSYKTKLIIYVTLLLLLIIFSFTGVIGAIEGAILFFIFVLFYFINFKESKKVSKKYVFEKSENPKKLIFDTIMLFVLGGVLVSLGAKFLVESAIYLASFLGVSESIIGFTCVAIGTSIPELTTAIMSIKKNCMQMSIGNIIGANILNGSLLLSIAVLINGRLVVDKLFVIVCMLVLILATILLFVPSIKKRKTNRFQGLIFVLLYVGYLVYLFVK